MANREMPVGVQDFEDLRVTGYAYVDKTAYVYRLAHSSKQYFLGRPRRFGKSLLLSTLKAYFLGKKELFTGLAVTDLEKDWIDYPVFHIDFLGENYSKPSGLDLKLDAILSRLEKDWGKDPSDITPGSRFQSLIEKAWKKTGKKVVVLIDEYDKPLLQAMENSQDYDLILDSLKAFYGVLKGADQWLRFVMLTGVTKFSKISVFSDLNQLRDISMVEEFAGICGITEAELLENFEPELKSLAKKRDMNFDEALSQMQKNFNGYHFSKDGPGIFNPFSVLNTFVNMDFGYYWFQTGTPTFLIKLLDQAGFDLRDFSEGVTISENSFADYRADGGNPVPILYQSGYLTIKAYDSQFREYTLGFPNEEVKYGFLENILMYHLPNPSGNKSLSVNSFVKDLQNGDVDAFMKRLKAFMADIPYPADHETERYYQNILYVIFSLIGQFVQTEVQSSQGRCDLLVRIGTAGKQDTLYIFELKLQGNGSSHTAREALEQIGKKGYLIPYTASGCKLIAIGAVFDKETRTLCEWEKAPLL